MSLNEAAFASAEEMTNMSDYLRVHVSKVAGAHVIDCGIHVPGGLEAGLEMANVCLAGHGYCELETVDGSPAIRVHSDHPVLACLGSQYAGWQVSVGRYFAMGSGPMRSIYAKEELFHDGTLTKEESEVAVGVLETRELPTEEVVRWVAEKLNLPTDALYFVVAPTASLAGSIQVVARSLETALHKLHALKFPIGSVLSGFGTAPLPPIAAKDMAAIGWTNDAILYGGQVTLWVNVEDDLLAEIGAKVPSSASVDFGEPFGEIFHRYNKDFYKIDPMLFSPAKITFHNLKSGRTHRFGKVQPEILARSFGY